MYIESLSIKQFRCFEQTEMSFQFPGRLHDRGLRLPNVNLLLGDNGTGKTTILKAIALSVLANIIQSTGFRPYFLVRRKGSQTEQQADINADLHLHRQDSYPVLREWPGKQDNKPFHILSQQVKIIRQHTTEILQPSGNTSPGYWEGLFVEDSAAFFLAGYGATRRVENSENFDSSARNKARALRYQRVAGLFEDFVSLTAVDVWRSEMKEQGRLDECLSIIAMLLPDNVKLNAENALQKEVLFLVRDTPLPFGALSDGYRAFIGWVGDLLYQMCRVTPSEHKLTDLRGVVMVDELDLLLHPAWQRTVVESLATTFPNLQFFFTSHSPIITGTLEAANIYVTETDPETGATTIVPGHERVHGLSADQILNSSYFDLPTSRAPDAVNQMNDLARDAWAGDEQASLEFLRRMTEGFEPVTSAAPAANSDTGAEQE